MGSFLSLFIHRELDTTLIEATYWTGILQLVAASLMALTAPLWGALCDRVGTKKILMIVLAFNVVVYTGLALSTSIVHVLLFRGLQGASGGISTVMFTLVASVVPAQELKKALSYQIAAMTLGSIFGPGLGGLLASIAGYRWTLATSSLLFLSITPLVAMLHTPPPRASDRISPTVPTPKLTNILPDVLALVLVYACISFITPTIPWFFESLGIPSEHLLTYTALATTLNGIAFVVATPVLTRVVTEITLPLLSMTAAGLIFLTAFTSEPYQFLVLRVAIGAVQAGVPPNLLGGGSERRGSVMGLLNSARFIGMAIGPFIATSILGNGEPPHTLYMSVTIASLSVSASLIIYFTHTRKLSSHV
jgi:DHA1 family multidrug resistance protein-like MFS transporter